MGKYEDPQKKRARHRAYYRRNITRESARSIEKRRRLIVAVKTLLLDHLRAHPCIDCGEADPIVLEFDHCNPRMKLFTMAEARRGKKTLSKVKEELAKCDVRCANCHRRRTMHQAAVGDIQFGMPIRDTPEASGTATTMAPSGPL